MIDLVISGMQSGADIAGLDAALKLGYEVGGFMPKAYRTEDGNKPEYKEKYNAVDTGIYNYLYRTEKNVIKADLTIVFELNSSSGSRHTVKFCKKHTKYYLHFKPKDRNRFKYMCNSIINIVKMTNPKTINIAGNRESTCPGIYKEVKKIILESLKQDNYE